MIDDPEHPDANPANWPKDRWTRTKVVNLAEHHARMEEDAVRTVVVRMAGEFLALLIILAITSTLFAVTISVVGRFMHPPEVEPESTEAAP